MRLLIFTLVLAGITIYVTTRTSSDSTKQEEWIPLFNGNDLADWTPKFTGFPKGENYRSTFRVSDSLLQVSYSEYDTFRNEFGHLFYKTPYSHYRLRAIYRMGLEGTPGGADWAFANNGLMLHCQSVESMGLEQEFPVSIEFQLLGGKGSGERPTGNLCTPGCHVVVGDTLYTTHCTDFYKGPTFHGDQWVEVEALVLGDSVIHHIVEGDTVLSYIKPVIGGELKGLDTTQIIAGTPMTEGYIAIQAESHLTEFKSIELLDLCGCMDKKAKNYKDYYVKDAPERCIY
ncbi:MAG: DUF1080 domain-containing protein [Bacteroidota bacterium]